MNEIEVFRMFTRESLKDRGWASFQMGMYYLHGLQSNGVVIATPSAALAQIYFNQGSKRKYRNCDIQLGDMHHFGLCGFITDDVTALVYYRRAADLGDASSAVRVGDILSSGDIPTDNSEVDESIALGYYEHAAALGSLSGMLSAAHMHREGTGLEDISEKDAFKYFTLAAATKNSGEAFYFLAWYYHTGIPGYLPFCNIKAYNLFVKSETLQFEGALHDLELKDHLRRLYNGKVYDQ